MNDKVRIVLFEMAAFLRMFQTQRLPAASLYVEAEALENKIGTLLAENSDIAEDDARPQGKAR
jgi:hypothetical protein